MRPCTRRIASAEDVIKATSLHDALGEHAPWCITAPNAPLIHIKPPTQRTTPPGRAPVAAPFRKTAIPATQTPATPSGDRAGSAYVAVST
jgi:hypothetical protein